MSCTRLGPTPTAYINYLALFVSFLSIPIPEDDILGVRDSSRYVAQFNKWGCELK